jgi:hypothetical protein
MFAYFGFLDVASKVRGEHEAWNFVNESKNFHFATVLPDAVLVRFCIRDGAS